MQEYRWIIWIIVLAFGLALMVLSFFVDNIGKFPRLASKLAPRYRPSLDAYERMFPASRDTPGPAITPDHPGFAGLASLISKRLSGPGDLTIASLRINKYAWVVVDTGQGMETTPIITLEITLRDERSKEIETRDLRAEIRKELFENFLFRWRIRIFLSGLVVALLAGLRPDLRAIARFMAGLLGAGEHHE